MAKNSRSNSLNNISLSLMSLELNYVETPIDTPPPKLLSDLHLWKKVYVLLELILFCLIS